MKIQNNSSPSEEFLYWLENLQNRSKKNISKQFGNMKAKKSKNGCSYAKVSDKKLLKALADASIRQTKRIKDAIANGSLILSEK